MTTMTCQEDNIGSYESIISTDLINVALNKPTTQISTDHGGVSSRAVDGNSDGNWHSQSVTHTTAISNPFRNVELQSEFAISTIKGYQTAAVIVSVTSSLQFIDLANKYILTTILEMLEV